MIGKTVSHYKILEKLGEGGMGVVYKAEDTKLKRTVALKFLPPHLAASEQDKARFVHEAKAASALDHPNICTIHEINETPDGQMFIVMALYEGSTLSEKIKRGPLAIRDSLDRAIQVAEGLHAAHEKGIVHRDIKPSNIIITSKRQVKIMDFGLARSKTMTHMTKTGSTVGTVPYISPEQARGEEVDQRTDIWSLGVLLYEMVTGRLPFPGDYDQAVIYQILHEEPKLLASLRSDVPMELQGIVSKAMKKDSSERYQRVGDMLIDLKLANKDVESGTFEKRPVTAGDRKRRPTYLIITGAVLLVALVIAGILYLALPAHRIDSLAVLPLENISGDPEQEYFVDGMTDQLITDLAKISALKVISRTSVMEYKGARKPLPQIAKSLNVDAIVEGSVVRSGNRVRITAQLIEAATDRHLWAESYDREFKDVLALQSDVARSIVHEINVKLTPQEESGLVFTQTVDVKAHDNYLKGRYFLEKGELEKSREYFESSLKEDPSFALAYAGMADYYSLLPFFTNTAPSMAFPKAKEAAIRALAIDKNLAEAHASLAYVKTYYDWDWQGAEVEFTRALELNPNSASIHHAFSRFLASQARLSEANREILRAKELDPLSLVIHANVGVIAYFGHQYDQATEQLEKTLEFDSTFSVAHWGLGLIYEQNGKLDQAIGKLEKVVQLTHGGVNALSSLAHAYALAGRREKAEQVLQDLKKRATTTYISSYQFALVYAGMKNTEQAFHWLEEAYKERSTLLSYLKMDPRFDNLHTDPRFSALLRKIGLTP